MQTKWIVTVLTLCAALALTPAMAQVQSVEAPGGDEVLRDASGRPLIGEDAGADEHEKAPLEQPRYPVQTNPARISFESPDESETVALTHNGEPVPASAVTGTKLYIGENDYDEFITVDRADGQLTITPTDSMQVGTYQLFINTNMGRGHLYIDAPLSELESILEKLARERNTTVQEIRREFGLTTTVREELTIRIPSDYYVGQELDVELPENGDEYTYVWRLNEEVLQQGPERRLVYAFDEPGPYILTVDAVAEGQVRARAVSPIEVLDDAGGERRRGQVAEPTGEADAQPIRREVLPGQSLSLAGPEGYERYVWLVDEEPVHQGRAFARSFERPGEYSVTVRAVRVSPDGDEQWRVIQYDVVVTEDQAQSQ